MVFGIQKEPGRIVVGLFVALFNVFSAFFPASIGVRLVYVVYKLV